MRLNETNSMTEQHGLVFGFENIITICTGGLKNNVYEEYLKFTTYNIKSVLNILLLIK